MKSGLVLITLRNGAANEAYPKNYGEKLMVGFDRQPTPYHVLIGEVSQYEDFHDDTFYNDFGLDVRMRFEEDEPVLYPLFDEIIQ